MDETLTEAAVRHVHHVMGTVVSFDVRPGRVDDERTRSAIAAACDVFDRDDAVFSTWRPDSPINRVRRAEISLWEAPDDVAEVFERCLHARHVTHGWFDAWALGGGFDPTGMVKGWSAMRALEELRSAGMDAAMLNAGGDIATFRCTGAAPWRIGVRDPDDPARMAFLVDCTHAVATSGSYERGEHILDPFRRTWTTAVCSATVTGPELDLADALATAAACAGLDSLPMIDELEGYEACLVLHDRTLRATRGFPFTAEPRQAG